MSLILAQATTDKVTVTNPLTFGAGTAFTYVQWVRQRAAPANSQGTGKGGVDMFAYSTGTTRWFSDVPRSGGSASSGWNNGTLFPDSNWTFLVLTYSETNGVLMHRGTQYEEPVVLTGVLPNISSGNTTANTGDLYIGNRGAFNALSPAHDLHLVELWPIEMTLAQITARWGGSLLTTAPSMRLLLGDNGTGTQPDLSGNGNSGTVTGATQGDNPPLMRRSRQIVVSRTAATTTTIRPSADVTDGAWLNEAASNVNLYASVDDDPTDDATWIQSPLTATPDAVTLALADPGGTPPSGEMTLTIRLRRV